MCFSLYLAEESISGPSRKRRRSAGPLQVRPVGFVCLGKKKIIKAADIEFPKWTVLLKIKPMQNCDHVANKCLTDLAISIHTDSNSNLTKCSTWELNSVMTL